MLVDWSKVDRNIIHILVEHRHELNACVGQVRKQKLQKQYYTSSYLVCQATISGFGVVTVK